MSPEILQPKFGFGEKIVEFKYILEECMTKWIKALLLAQQNRTGMLQTVTKKVVLSSPNGNTVKSCSNSHSKQCCFCCNRALI